MSKKKEFSKEEFAYKIFWNFVAELIILIIKFPLIMKNSSLINCPQIISVLYSYNH